MFIKWRLYQRQLNGIKGDKYISQPIIVKAVRVGKKGFLKHLKEQHGEDVDMDRFNAIWENEAIRKKILRPRHEVVFELPSYPVCMIIYFRSPEFVKQRYQWWEKVDALFAQRVKKWPDTMTEETAEKLKADIEKVVPRVTPEEVQKLSVVLNDLPLHL